MAVELDEGGPLKAVGEEWQAGMDGLALELGELRWGCGGCCCCCC